MMVRWTGERLSSHTANIFGIAEDTPEPLQTEIVQDGPKDKPQEFIETRAVESGELIARGPFLR